MAWQAACAWIDGNLGQFTIPAHAPTESVLASLKAIAELVHAADLLERTKNPEARTYARRWVDHAWSEVGQGDVLRDTLARDPRLLPVVVAVAPFELVGLHDSATLAVIHEQLPRATLSELAWTFVVPALDLLGVPVPAATRAQAAAHSVLASRVDPRQLTDDQVYVLVHECFYATRWGRRPLEAPDTDVESTLPALIGRAYVARDPDLLAELVLAARCARVAVASHALDVVARAQSNEGNVVPAPPRPGALPRFTHPTLARTYHTTLAAIMAWSADIFGA